MNNNKKGPEFLKALIMYAVIFLVVALIVTSLSGGDFFGGGGDTVEQFEYSQLIKEFEKGNIASISINETSLSYTGQLKNGTKFTCSVPSSYDMAVITEKYVVPQAAEGMLSVTTVKSSFLMGLISWIPTIDRKSVV